MIYGISPLIQKEEVHRFCFNTCGKIIVGAVYDCEAGSFFPCREDVCPYEDKHTEVIGIVGGEEFRMRKLLGV